MPKIYTKTGDKGQTSLFNGKRVSKSNELIDLLGSLDELNSSLGLIASLSKDKIKKDISEIQSVIFQIGTEVAYPEKHGKLKIETYIKRLEEKMDLMEEKLPKLTNFILPGGSELSSNIHISRTIVRRVERLFILKENIYKNISVNIYLNRLSDYLFVLARFVNNQKGIKDTIWNRSH